MNHDSGLDGREDRLADFSRDRRVLLLTGLALVIGAVGAAVAWVLLKLIALFTNLAYFQTLSTAPAAAAAHRLGAWSILVPVAGGIVIGLMARYGTDRIRGHGIPEALEAILAGRSRMSFKVAVLKPLSSAISIGTGGPFGAEGPIIMTGGAFGSLLAQAFRLSSAERKTLLVAGAAAGMSAVFASPVAAALLAVELLLFEWRPRSFIPVAAAAAIAGALRVPLLGAGPVFPIPAHAPATGAQIGLGVVLGLACGLASGGLTVLVYAFEDLFRKLPVHWMWWPAIGGLAVGAIGLAEPRILGVGYASIEALLRGSLAGSFVLGLLVAKALAWSFSLGSGTSGGVLAPLLLMGGCIGAFAAGWFPGGDPGLWALVGMAAMMGGTMRSPLTAMAFGLELTHDLNALPVLLSGCIAAHLVTVLLMRRSILTEKVARRGLHVTREYGVDPLELVRIGDAMETDPPTVSHLTTVAELSRRIAQGDPTLSPRQAVPVVDGSGRLAGIVTRGDLVRSLGRRSDGGETVLEAGARDLVVAYPDEVVRDAVERMLRHDIGRLPVVSREDPKRLLGYLGRSRVIGARRAQLEQETVREGGWPRASAT